MFSNTITLPEFIAANGLSMECEWAERNPMADDQWSRDATHYRCTIKRSGERKAMTLHYSMGSAHTDEPDLPMVLDSLASDASSVIDSPDWLDWANEMGYVESGDAEVSRRTAGETHKALKQARETHAAIVKQADELKALLGDDAFETLLYSTERL